MTTGKTVYEDTDFEKLGKDEVYYYKIIAVAAMNEKRLVSDMSLYTFASPLEDKQAPAVPPNLSATVDDARPYEVQLSWNVSTTDENGEEITGLEGYRIYRFTGGEESYMLLTDVSDATYPDVDLKAKTVYTYAVSAYDAWENESARSDGVSVETGGIATPNGLSGEGKIKQVEIRWDASTDDKLIGYRVYKSDRSDGTYQLLLPFGGLFTTGETEYTDTEVSVGKTYYYKVSAMTEDSLESELSSYVHAKALSDDVAPEPPRNVSVVLVSGKVDEVQVSWKTPLKDADGGNLTGLQGYRIYRSTSATGSFLEIADVQTLSYTDSGLTPNTTYYYTRSLDKSFAL